jgi:pSer/pThr/pTyr-binding forkhead associated (FHA) protein
VFCTRCGHSNPPDSRFCAKCGAPTDTSSTGSGTGDSAPAAEQTSTIALTPIDGEHEEEPAGEDAGVEGLAPGTALLVVKRGPNAGSRFLLDRDVTTAGRHPESDIFLDDVTVSRRHAEFRRDEAGGFTLADVGSLNGSYLNRSRIEASPLTGGDEVQIGKFRLVFFAATRGEGGA